MKKYAIIHTRKDWAGCTTILFMRIFLFPQRLAQNSARTFSAGTAVFDQALAVKYLRPSVSVWLDSGQSMQPTQAGSFCTIFWRSSMSGQLARMSRASSQARKIEKVQGNWPTRPHWVKLFSFVASPSQSQMMSRFGSSLGSRFFTSSGRHVEQKSQPARRTFASGQSRCARERNLSSAAILRLKLSWRFVQQRLSPRPMVCSSCCDAPWPYSSTAVLVSFQYSSAHFSSRMSHT